MTREIVTNAAASEGLVYLRRMTDRAISTDPEGPQARVLNHAGEFVELVFREAPTEYRRLMGEVRFAQELERDSPFNLGKLYVYAEFVVFRREFRTRFSEANRSACINAFCKLFLKNDISVTNLVNFVEGAEEDEMLLLKRKSRHPL
jgi:hypothetical protein